MKRHLVSLGVLALALGAFGGTPALIPLPRQMQVGSGSFTLCPAQAFPGAPTLAATKILTDAASHETGQYL